MSQRRSSKPNIDSVEYWLQAKRLSDENSELRDKVIRLEKRNRKLSLKVKDLLTEIEVVDARSESGDDNDGVPDVFDAMSMNGTFKRW